MNYEECFEFSQNKKGEITILAYNGTDKDVVVPATIKDSPVVVIGPRAFSPNQKKASDNIKELRASITSVRLHDSVSYIDKSAFNGCSNLEKITMPSLMEYIGENAFVDCGKLTEITIPQGVEVLEKGLFRGCVSLKTINLPVTLKEIKSGVFYGCNSVKNLKFPNNEIIFDPLMFDGFDYNGRIVVTEEMVKRNPKWLVYANNIQPDLSSDNIKFGAYSGNMSLFEAVWHKGIKQIGEAAYAGCSNLERIDNQSNVVDVGAGAFVACNKISSVPSGLLSIGDFAFIGNKMIQKASFGEETTKIGMFSFYGAKSLCDIELTGKKDYIGHMAFAKCLKLENVYCSDFSIEKIEDDAFVANENITFHLDEGSKSIIPYLEKLNLKYCIS